MTNQMKLYASIYLTAFGSWPIIDQRFRAIDIAAHLVGLVFTLVYLAVKWAEVEDRQKETG